MTLSSHDSLTVGPLGYPPSPDRESNETLLGVDESIATGSGSVSVERAKGIGVITYVGELPSREPVYISLQDLLL